MDKSPEMEAGMAVGMAVSRVETAVSVGEMVAAESMETAVSVAGAVIAGFVETAVSAAVVGEMEMAVAVSSSVVSEDNPQADNVVANPIKSKRRSGLARMSYYSITTVLIIRDNLDSDI